MLEKQKCKK